MTFGQKKNEDDDKKEYMIPISEKQLWETS